jgi:acetyltransferase-like isoleucine patch superfamily enzyme
MRREIAAYERSYPRPHQPLWCIHEIRRRMGFAFLRYRIRSLRTGSHSWHLLQEKLSSRSSLGLDLEMRGWFYMATLPNCGPELCIFPGTIIYYPQNVFLGRNVFINRGVQITAQAPVNIGSEVLIGPYVVINSGNHRYADASHSIRDQGHNVSSIVIGDDVWIGAHVTILAGVTIGTGAVVAAGAVVTNDVEAFSLVAGVPARRIGGREV